MTTTEFNNLPREEKAILVAKDIIEQIKIGRYIPNSGQYISGVRSYNGNDFELESELCDVFDEIKECKVCALGATILSATHLGNRLKIEDLNINYGANVYRLKHKKVVGLLDSIFSDETLFLIESCFEGFVQGDDRYAVDVKGLDEDSFDGDILDACDDFKEKYKDTEDRLIAICNNIIANGGEFKI